MSTKDTASGSADYLDPYKEAVKKHGPSFESTLWHSREKQRGRFEVMAGMVPLTGRTIVDAGAGIGDFARYLHEEGIEYGRFVGLEGVPAMVEKGNRLDLPEFAMIESDFSSETDAFRAHTPDVIVFSGSLNTFGQDDAIKVLERAWDAAREAVLFNFLSARNHMKNAPDPSPARRFDPLRMIDWALTKTPSVMFRQDYFNGHDATVGMVSVASGRAMRS